MTDCYFDHCMCVHGWVDLYVLLFVCVYLFACLHVHACAYRKCMKE